MITINQDQITAFNKQMLRPLILETKQHLLSTFPNIQTIRNNEGDKLIQNIEATLHNILEYNIHTKALTKRFLELSVVFGWGLYKQKEVKAILLKSDLPGFNKIKEIEKLLTADGV